MPFSLLYRKKKEKKASTSIPLTGKTHLNSMQRKGERNRQRTKESAVLYHSP